MSWKQVTYLSFGNWIVCSTTKAKIIGCFYNNIPCSSFSNPFNVEEGIKRGIIVQQRDLYIETSNKTCRYPRSSMLSCFIIILVWNIPLRELKFPSRDVLYKTIIRNPITQTSSSQVPVMGNFIQKLY